MILWFFAIENFCINYGLAWIFYFFERFFTSLKLKIFSIFLENRNINLVSKQNNNNFWKLFNFLCWLYNSCKLQVCWEINISVYPVSVFILAISCTRWANVSVYHTKKVNIWGNGKKLEIMIVKNESFFQWRPSIIANAYILGTWTFYRLHLMMIIRISRLSDSLYT